ncbi:MAG: hypothetical protein P4L36_16290 [Holophaga sp.]|nr:hypothetical protein [Holophaga sp.]
MELSVQTATVNMKHLVMKKTNVCGQLASIATPIVIGCILAWTKSFELALVYVGGLAILGALSYLFIVQDIHRVELDPKQ